MSHRPPHTWFSVLGDEALTVAMPTRLLIALLLLSVCVAEDAPEVTASQAQWLEWTVFDSDLIVEGRVTADRGGIVVEVVHYDSTKRALLAVGTVFPLIIHVPGPALARPPWHKPVSEGIPLAPDNQAVWFIDERTDEHGIVTYQVKKTKWLVDHVVYSEQQVINPGPYYLLPDPCHDVITLRKLIASLLPRRRAFDLAINEPDPSARLDRLAPFLQPEVLWSYFRRSAELLSAMGPAGIAILQREAERPEQQKRQCELIQIMGRSKDASAVPYLIGIAHDARLQLAAVAGAFDRERVSMAALEAMNRWSSAIYALAESGDERALAEFRETAIWGAHHRVQELVEYSVRGLGRRPRAENIPCFTAVFAALPRETDGFGRFPAYYALLALIEHRYSDALPIFCTQLDHPDEYNRRQAHRGLVELIGRDLGTSPEPWLALYAEQLRERPRRNRPAP